MSLRSNLTRCISAWALVALSPSALAQGGLGGGGPVSAEPGMGLCVSALERQMVQEQVSALGSVAPIPFGGGAPAPFTFYPIGGRVGQDAFVGNYVDLDPSGGALDWHCTAYTYDGHLGSDCDIRSFAEQVIGVPVFAAQDGVVVATLDGFPDMNTSWGGQPANSVVIAHPGGRVAYYWHLRNGSVTVVPGQSVRAGEQIGQVGSSGVSAGPHLHFEVWDNGNVVEPWAGPCHAAASQWTDPPPFSGETTFIRDFAICRTNPAGAGWPYESPRDSEWVTSDGSVYFWVLAQAIPANSVWRVRFLRPDGTLSFDSGTYPFGNPDYQFAWWWWNWWVPEMQTITGTWSLHLEFNGTIVLNAPFEVVTAPTPGFNRPPEPIVANLVPADPSAADVIRCEVAGDLVLDDLDWDIVRYRYLWKVNGAVVRDIVSAGRADAIAHHVAAGGDTVTCDVTPMDDQVAGGTVTTSAVVRSLSGSASAISLAAGGTVSFALDVGDSFGGAPYVVVASLTGDAPGFPLPGGLVLPIVYDEWTEVTVLYPNTPPYTNTLGALSPTGTASPALTLPAGLPPAFAGITAWHAALVLGTPWLATNAATVQTVP